MGNCGLGGVKIMTLEGSVHHMKEARTGQESPTPQTNSPVWSVD